MDQNTIVALTTAGVVTPWLTEIIKVFAPGDYNGKKALTLSMIVSILISGGVLWFNHALAWNNPVQLFTSAGIVLGISGTVYQYIQKAVQTPVQAVKNAFK